MLAQKLSALRFLLFRDRQEQMLGRDVLVLHLLSLLLRRREYLGQARTEILLAALDFRKARDGRLAIIEHNLDICAQLAEQGTHNSLCLFEHRAQKVLGLDLLILIPLSQFNAGLDGFLSPKCEFV